MFRLFVCINLILVYVFCQTTEDNLQFNTDFSETQSWQQKTDYETTQSWNDVTTENPLELTTNYDTTQSWNEATTENPLELTTNYDTTQSWNEATTENPLELTTNYDTTQSLEQITTGQPMEESTNGDTTQAWGNFTTTIQQITSTMTTTSIPTCQANITCDISEETKKEIIDTVLLAVSRDIASQLEAIEARLSELVGSNNDTKPPIKLSWQIYENLQIPLTGWLRVFDQPYSHKTRTEDLNQIAGICHNQVLVAATFNGSISVAAVGPARLLTLNTMWNQPQQLGQVYWYRTSGKSFGFSPSATIRQTSADNEDLNSPLRLSWLLDQNVGGYRAGTTRSLADNSLWHKVIYCN
jgi:hypothetical protein